MNVDISQTELFERYLQNHMIDSEVKEFEARLKIDPDFAEAFELHKEIDMALVEEELFLFRQELERIHLETNEEAITPDFMPASELKELDQAILEQDVTALRSQLNHVYDELEDELATEYIPSYRAVENAVANQDSVALHTGLEMFNSGGQSEVAAELAENDLLEQEIDRAVAQHDVIEFRQTLAKVAAEIHPTVRMVPVRTKVIRAVAAAALVTLFLSSGILLTQHSTPDQWINRNLDKMAMEEVGPGPARGADDQSHSIVSMAYENFSAGDYSDAVKLYALAEENGESGAHIWNYKGRAHYELGEYESAMPYFEAILVNNDNSFLEEADWYMIKCLIRLDRKEEVVPRLTAILNSEHHDYKNSAAKLYDKMVK